MAHKWARWLHNSCRLGDPHRFRAGENPRCQPFLNSPRNSEYFENRHIGSNKKISPCRMPKTKYPAPLAPTKHIVPCDNFGVRRGGGGGSPPLWGRVPTRIDPRAPEHNAPSTLCPRNTMPPEQHAPWTLSDYAPGTLCPWNTIPQQHYARGTLCLRNSTHTPTAHSSHKQRLLQKYARILGVNLSIWARVP